MINVTKTFLPSIEEYSSLLERIWINQWLPNRGELVLDLEENLKHLLGFPNILVTNYRTVLLPNALKLFGNEGEVITTTPFSYVASTFSIVWENCKPVFVDIKPEYLVIDKNKIEPAIATNTTVILATHAFSNPCRVQVIQGIAKKHKLNILNDDADLGYFNSIITHDCEIGDFVEITSNATILGRNKIEDCSSIGGGASILPDVETGKKVIVGAGTVVLEGVPYKINSN